MNRAYWQFLRVTERLGRLGLAAAAIWIFCILFVFGSWMPTRDALSRVLNVKTQAPLQVASPEMSQAQGLKQFLDHFPHHSERSQYIQQLMGKAKALNLLIDNVSYKAERKEGSPFSQIYIDFTTYSSYLQMRTFLDDVMTEMQFISLDQLSINRDDLNSDIVSARMRLTLHMVN